MSIEENVNKKLFPKSKPMQRARIISQEEDAQQKINKIIDAIQKGAKRQS